MSKTSVDQRIPEYVGSFYFNSGWQDARPRGKRELPDLLEDLGLDKCHTFDDVVDVLRDGGWNETCPSSAHWNFSKDGWSCEVRGPHAQAEFHLFQ